MICQRIRLIWSLSLVVTVLFSFVFGSIYVSGYYEEENEISTTTTMTVTECTETGTNTATRNETTTTTLKTTTTTTVIEMSEKSDQNSIEMSEEPSSDRKFSNAYPFKEYTMSDLKLIGFMIYIEVGTEGYCSDEEQLDAGSVLYNNAYNTSIEKTINSGTYAIYYEYDGVHYSQEKDALVDCNENVIYYSSNIPSRCFKHAKMILDRTYAINRDLIYCADPEIVLSNASEICTMYTRPEGCCLYDTYIGYK